MDRVNSILFHPMYQQYLKKIQSLEADRKFCGHTMEHFLAVARLSFIMVQESDLKIDKEVVYAAALLHDIGRWLEYEEGIPHHEGSARIAREIIPECGFDEVELAVIVQAIKGHRKTANEKCRETWDKEQCELLNKGGFSRIFQLADKLSRNCFDCPVADECNWPDERKNKGITL